MREFVSRAPLGSAEELSPSREGWSPAQARVVRAERLERDEQAPLRLLDRAPLDHRHEELKRRAQHGKAGPVTLERTLQLARRGPHRH